MNDNQARTICTAFVWIATSLIFICGVFRFNWTGLPAGMLWAIVAFMLAAAPAIATRAIWNPTRPEKTQDKAPGQPPSER